MELTYNKAYHLRCELALLSGRTVILRALHQSMTYDVWLEGAPSAWSNDRIVAGILQEAKQYCAGGARPLLIPPVRRDFLREPGDMARHVSLRGRVPEWLPMVICMGVLQDEFPVRDQSKTLSVLTVVWFQNEFAPPIDAGVFEQLLVIDWERLATDIDI